MADAATPSRRPWVAVAAALAVGAAVLVAAWRRRYLVDDAFISFRYARNLLEGHGLVYNPGEWVEGYTNLAWVLELAALWGAFGVRPEGAAVALGLLATGATLALAFTLAAGSGPTTSGARGLLAVVLLGTHDATVRWATSGLETRQVTALLLATWAASAASLTRPAWAWVAAAAALAGALTRPEGALFAACVALALAVRAARGQSLTTHVGALVALAGGGAALEAWRVATYGAWVPNTYVAKVVQPWWEGGALWLGEALLEHGAWWVAPLALVGVATRWRQPATWLALPVVAVWLLFRVRMGGDHFGERSLDVLWPVLAVGAAVGIDAIARRARWPRVAAATLALVAVGAQQLLPRAVAASPSTGGATAAAGLPSVLAAIPPVHALATSRDRLRARLDPHKVGIRQLDLPWLQQGYGPLEEAREALRPLAGTMVAVEFAGAPAFYLPDLRFVDTFGLTDPVIARGPVLPGPYKLAHARRPPRGWLSVRGVALRVHPVTYDRAAALHAASYAVALADGRWWPVDTDDPPLLERLGAGLTVAARPAAKVAPPSIKDCVRVEGETWRIVRPLTDVGVWGSDAPWEPAPVPPMLGVEAATATAGPWIDGQPDRALGWLLHGRPGGVSAVDDPLTEVRTVYGTPRTVRAIVPLSPGRRTRLVVTRPADGTGGLHLQEAAVLAWASADAEPGLSRADPPFDGVAHPSILRRADDAPSPGALDAAPPSAASGAR